MTRGRPGDTNRPQGTTEYLYEQKFDMNDCRRDTAVG